MTDTDSIAQSVDTFSDYLKNVDITKDDGVERLVVGLDFGTTYSGVAYAFTTKPDQIYTINDWPGAKGRTSPKCPTLIKYNANDSYMWGFELDRTTGERIEGIKLLLDPDQPKPLYVPAINTEAELKRLGKPAVAVATDFIHAIFQHALRKIEAKYPKSYLEMLDKQYVLSVPAVWSDKAKDATLRAARNAGIAPIQLIKEPEAAALFTLNEMGSKGLRVGDALVLCDAGGGTVDLISYEITKLNPLELKELVTSTGGLAGSLMLNKRFEEWVSNVVGERAYIELRQTDAYRLAMKTFDENIKPGFRSRDDQDQYVNFPKAGLADDPAKGLESNTITINGKVLHDIFEPIFQNIDKLVSEQVMKVRLKRMKDKHPNGYDIKAIFLVGGFGSSSYLYESICNAHLDVQVIQPNDAWSAIVRGAVMSHLPTTASITSNVAPKHYGVSANSVYEEEDSGEQKHWDSYESVWRVTKMTWYIHKGDDLLRSRKIEFPFYRTFDPNPSYDQLQIEASLKECGSDKAPDYPNGVVTQNCTMKTDLSMISPDLFKKKTGPDGKEYWQLYYKLLVTIQSGPMIFSIVCGGKEYGQVGTDY